MNIQTSYYPSCEDFFKQKREHNLQYLIFCAENTPFHLEAFNAKSINYMGAVFPKIIYENEVYEEGLLVFEIDESIDVLFI